MANRTVNFEGYGYGSTTVNAVVTFNGTTVFSGTVPTLNQSEVSIDPDQQAVLFNFEIPVDISGTFPVTVTFTGGDSAFVMQVESNYMPVGNPVYSEDDLKKLINPTTLQQQRIAIWTPLANPPLSSADLEILDRGTPEEQNVVLAAHGLSLTVSGGASNYQFIAPAQCKTNVMVNGQPQAALGFPPGEWGYLVPIIGGAGTLTFNLQVELGQ